MEIEIFKKIVLCGIEHSYFKIYITFDSVYLPKKVINYSRYTWVFPLKQKYEVVKILEDFVVFIQTQFEIAVKVIRSDNGTKFFMTNFILSIKE